MDAPRSVEIGDINRDEIPDLVLTALDRVIALLGRGGGEFGPPAGFGSGINTADLALGDFDQDGILDVATANAGHVVWGWSDSILRGDGQGSFALVTSYAAILWPIAIVAADFDADGHLDLASASEGSGAINLLLGNGNGSFRSSSASAGRDAGHLAVADLDLDGHLDLVVPLRGGPQDSVAILPGNGDGSFAQPVDFATGANPYAAAIADLNGDGRPDVITANVGDGSVSVLLNETVVEFPLTRYPLRLADPFPDPAISHVTLQFTNPVETRIHLAIYDSAGRLVKTLIDAVLPPGPHSTTWDLRTDRGVQASSGIYLCELRSLFIRVTQRLAVLH